MYKIINRTLIFVLISLIIVMVSKILYKSSMGSPPAAATTIIETPSEPDLTKEQVEVMINNYLMNNPEIIIASIEQFQKNKGNDSAARVNCVLEQTKLKKNNVDNFPILGNPEGNIVIEELFDYNCSFCKKGGIILEQMAEKNKNIKVILRPFPILGENSLYLAKLILAINKAAPSKFKEIHKELLESNTQQTEQVIRILFKQHDVEYELIDKLLDKKDIIDLLNKNFKIAEDLKIRGVPAYIINGVLTSGGATLQDFEKIINNIPSQNVDN